MNTTPSYKYAGFWWRLLAGILDWFVALVLSFVLASAAGGIMGLEMAVNHVPLDAQAQANFHLVGYLVGVITQWLYYTLFESSRWQATPGGKMCGLRVTDLQGDRIGFGRANGRYWGAIISAIILFFGFFMIGWTKRKQGLHDMMAGTLVLRRQVSPQERVELPDGRGDLLSTRRSVPAH